MVYSETSNSRPSEIGTQYDRPLYKGRCSRSHNYSPCSSITPRTSKRGQPLYNIHVQCMKDKTAVFVHVDEKRLLGSLEST